MPIFPNPNKNGNMSNKIEKKNSAPPPPLLMFYTQDLYGEPENNEC